MNLKLGDRAIVFDYEEWSRTGDVGDNSQFRKPAVIVAIRADADGVFVADVRFDCRSNEISRGHFILVMRRMV